jgi:hypothetical protein
VAGTRKPIQSAPAGYSGTPLAKKLGVKPEHTLALVGAPGGWEVPDLPPDVVVRHGMRSRADVVIAFVRRAAELDTVLTAVVPKLGPEDAMWVAWPRRAGGHDSDITDNVLREILLPTGLVDVKVAAIDANWSGLRFVWRKELRPGRR